MLALRTLLASASVIGIFAASTVWGQSSAGLGTTLNRPNSLSRNNYASGMNSTRVGGLYGSGGSLRSKPFAAYTPQEPVSPYLNLFRVDLNGTNQFNYSTLVRPQLQQQQTNEQLERQNLQNARRLQAIAAQPTSNPEGAKDQYPTGHQTVFNYMGHYFPQPQHRQKKQAGQQ
ncbi:MAG: hypothetical protein U0805_16580 [Pirellulales bacterium]